MSSVWIVKIQAASLSKAAAYWQEATVSTARSTGQLNICQSSETAAAAWRWPRAKQEGEPADMLVPDAPPLITQPLSSSARWDAFERSRVHICVLMPGWGSCPGPGGLELQLQHHLLRCFQLRTPSFVLWNLRFEGLKPKHKWLQLERVVWADAAAGGFDAAAGSDWDSRRPRLVLAWFCWGRLAKVHAWWTDRNLRQRQVLFLFLGTLKGDLLF